MSPANMNHRNWIGDVRGHGVAVAAKAIGLEYDERRRALSPCAACAADRRHPRRHDRRGALGLTRDGAGFRCFECGVGGDAVDLVALSALDGRKAKTRDEWRKVWGAAADAGLCQPPPGHRVRVPLRPLPPRHEPAPAEYLPSDELTAFWGVAGPVDKDESVSAFLRRRGIDPVQIAAADLARALPLDVAVFPPWWPESRARIWRLAVLAFDSQGVPRNIQARAVVDLRDGAPPQLWPKHPKEKTYSASTLFFADAAGVRLLRGDAVPGLSTVLITEGLTDMLAASLWCSRTQRAQAVLSVFSGSARGLRDVRWPPHIAIYAATDPDAVGDEYAAEVRAAVPAEIRVRRVNLRTVEGT